MVQGTTGLGVRWCRRWPSRSLFAACQETITLWVREKIPKELAPEREGVWVPEPALKVSVTLIELPPARLPGAIGMVGLGAMPHGGDLLHAGRPLAALPLLLPEEGATLSFRADIALWRVRACWPRAKGRKPTTACWAPRRSSSRSNWIIWSALPTRSRSSSKQTPEVSS